MATTTIELKSFTERAELTGSRVDRDAKMIRGVKIIGFESRNKRRYPRTTLEAALPLYEDRPVILGVATKNGTADHARRSSDAFGERAGVIKNPYMAEDGVRGDILLRTDSGGELTEASGTLAWYAEQAPRGVALSHDAEGIQEGDTVTEIARVNVVEVVDHGATNDGLFESETNPMSNETKTLTIQQVAESVPAATKGAVNLVGLLEMEDMVPPDTPVEMASDTSAEEQVEMAFTAAAQAVVADPNINAKDSGKKVAEILSAKEKLMGAPTTPETEAEEDDEEEKPNGMTESAKDQRIQQLESREDARKLIESMGREVSEKIVAAVAAVPESDRRGLIETWPKKGSNLRPDSSPPMLESDSESELNFPSGADRRAFLRSKS